MIITLPQLLSTFQHSGRLCHTKLRLLQNGNVTNAYIVSAERLETKICTLSAKLFGYIFMAPLTIDFNSIKQGIARPFDICCSVSNVHRDSKEQGRVAIIFLAF